MSSNKMDGEKSPRTQTATGLNLFVLFSFFLEERKWIQTVHLEDHSLGNGRLVTTTMSLNRFLFSFWKRHRGDH